jgi:hypothetical protein
VRTRPPGRAPGRAPARPRRRPAGSSRAAHLTPALYPLRPPQRSSPKRLKDVIFGFGSSSVYVVLECLDCDLRDLLDRDDAAVDMRQVKVRAVRRRRV